jgi:sulfite reductase (NADPH) flavoprotein alpha-component
MQGKQPDFRHESAAMSTVPAGLRPLDSEREQLLSRLVDGLDAQALTWISGFTAGVAAERGRSLREEPAPLRADDALRATVLYGSQTGNGRRLAERVARNVEGAGFAVRVISAADYPVRSLADERLLFVVISTHGDGDPPDDARTLVDFVLSKRAPRLDKLGFAVFALGDSSYPQFCAVGRLLDDRLASLGARRLLPRVEADLDIEPAAAPWLEQVLGTVRSEAGAPRLATVTPLRAVTTPEVTRDHPLEAEVLANYLITGRGASRDVRHVEIAIPEGRLRYEPGDSLGIWPHNSPAAIARIASLLGVPANLPVEIAGRDRPLAEWLGTEREITRLTRPFIELHARRSANPELLRLLTPEHAAAFRRVLRDSQVADLLQEYPAAWSPGELVAALRPLAPRLYSIASSWREVGNEVHLTVAVLSDERQGVVRTGAVSEYVAEHAPEGARLRVFLESNPRFRLPASGDRDIIMIGPGTGVAPYRGFVQERAAAGDKGRQWLFFGARHFDSEFLYQTEWLEALKRGTLTRLDVAFSRDQPEKIYVQQRLRERGAELFRWLEDGACLYVCGDAEHMAPDVHKALVEIVAQHGARDQDTAEEYVRALAQDKRYLRDVY